MERFTIQKPDGTRLAALYAAPEKGFRYVVIICHGFSGAKENSGHLFPFVEQLNANGFAALAFDFAGSGESDGDFSTLTLSRQIADLKAVLDHVETQLGVPAILLGRSFGGSTIIGAGGDERVAGLCLWSAAIRLEEVFRKGFGEHYAKMEQGEAIHTKIIDSMIDMEPDFVRDLKQHDMQAYLKEVNPKPVLALQGMNDWLVAPDNADIVRECCENAEVQFIEAADHRFENHKNLRDDLTVEWLLKHFPA